MTASPISATTIASTDGVPIAIQEWGNPKGREILFIHGYNQAHLSWQRQFTDAALAAEFRMVTLDLRGHGASGKPLNRETYADDKLWGDDIAAVISATGLKRPVLVGWSYGGRIISDYLRHHGVDRIAGINYAAARTANIATSFGPGRAHMAGMMSEDLATNIAGTRAFLRACFEIQPSQDDFETMLAFNMVVPAIVRSHVLGRAPDDGAIMHKLTCPVLVTHGRSDRIILPALAEFSASSVSGAKLSLYDGVGHSPFWEDAPRFNRELAELVRAT
jgi:pimeloyl-ACP methyl ester carboxylesterase